MPADGHAGVRALTYHLLVLLDDHVGIRPQEDVKIQHPPDGPPGQARSRLQDHLLGGGRGRKEKKTVTIGEQLPDPHGGDQAAPQATLIPWQGNGEIPALCSVDAEWASGGFKSSQPREIAGSRRERACYLKNLFFKPKAAPFSQLPLKDQAHAGLSFASSPQIPS